MPRLQVASAQQIETIYRESHAVWGAGLSRENYLGLWNDVSRTAWVRGHARFYVWLDDASRLASSIKLYRLRASLHGRPSRLGVLGAIFTPAAMRRRGHATAMVRHVLEREREEGSALALLFSDIGTRFYENFGFRSPASGRAMGAVVARAPYGGTRMGVACAARGGRFRSSRGPRRRRRPASARRATRR